MKPVRGPLWSVDHNLRAIDVDAYIFWFYEIKLSYSNYYIYPVGIFYCCFWMYWIWRMAGQQMSIQQRHKCMQFRHRNRGDRLSRKCSSISHRLYVQQYLQHQGASANCYCRHGFFRYYLFIECLVLKNLVQWDFDYNYSWKYSVDMCFSAFFVYIL